MQDLRVERVQEAAAAAGSNHAGARHVERICSSSAAQRGECDRAAPGQQQGSRAKCMGYGSCG